MSDFHTEYGIICNTDDEKKIVRSINAFMAKEYEYRKMYKRTNESLLEARLPFVYNHFYCQFLKQSPRWYFELYPNSDLNSTVKFADHPEVGWVIFVNKMAYSEPENREHLDAFFNELLLATGFETILLHQYKDGDDRL